jgi:hypothetical protein
MDAVRAAAISAVVLFWTVLLTVVPVTTGFPAGKLYDPEPFLGIFCTPIPFHGIIYLWLFAGNFDAV